MAAVIYHEHCRYNFRKIATLWPFKDTTLQHTTISRNYNEVKDNNLDCYFNNQKGHVGRKKSISDAEMAEAIEGLRESVDRFARVKTVIVVALNGGLFDGSVHALHLSVGPRMIGFGFTEVPLESV